MSRVSHLLIHTCDIQRKTRTQVSPGKWQETYATVYSNVRCRVFCASATERMAAQRLETLTSDTGYLEPDQDIVRDDQLANVRREDGTVDPVNYRVTGVNKPSIAHHTKLGLQNIARG